MAQAMAWIGSVHNVCYVQQPTARYTSLTVCDPSGRGRALSFGLCSIWACHVKSGSALTLGLCSTWAHYVKSGSALTFGLCQPQAAIPSCAAA